VNIETLVSPIEERFSSLHREIKELEPDRYEFFADDHDDSQLADEIEAWLAEQDEREPLGASLRLNATQRYNTRQRAARAALLGWRHRGVVHYTQRWQRWEGIKNRDHAAEGQYPNHADCSAYVTWCLWDATRLYKAGDFVNGAGWRAGFTGTMTRHGVQVSYNKLITGDAIFYGGTWSRPHHVAIYVGRGLVVSHGSESGPLLLRWNYRPVNHCRRYIR